MPRRYIYIISALCVLVAVCSMTRVLLARANAVEIPGVERRQSAWPQRQGGFRTIDASSAGSTAQSDDLIPDEWMGVPHCAVSGIPFEIPNRPALFRGTRMDEKESVSVEIPSDAREILFLMKADFPDKEAFGGWDTEGKLEYIDQPEKAFFELVYTDGSSDQLFPINVGKKRFGLSHGVGVYAIHPYSGKQPAKLVLHDRMSNGAFTYFAITINSDEPKIEEPDTRPVWYPAVDKVKPGPATVSFRTTGGLTWGSIESSMLPSPVDLSASPVFNFKLGEKEIPSTAWQVVSVKDQADAYTATLRYVEGNVVLRAIFNAKRIAPAQTAVSLDVSNVGGEKVTGTLFFPYVTGLSIGSTDDTWYICNRDSAVINKVVASWRDYIGSSHPFQWDGFFNPKAGVGIAFMSQKSDETFRWYRLGKDGKGCGYSWEFMPRTLSKGGKWESVPVTLSVIPGDWKDQLASYKKWLNSWYKLGAPRKEWFKNVFAWQFSWPIPNRTWLQQANEFRDIFGYCDMHHIFAWANTQKYGHWGDYDHFETVGGKEKFIKDVAEIQNAGIPLGLYLDGYLMTANSINVTKAQKDAWCVWSPDGKPFGDFNSMVMCPYVKEWRDYLVSVYVRLARDIKPKGLYIDEFGMNLNLRSCYNPHHGHPVPMGLSPGETIFLKELRAALPIDVATYTEMSGTDAMSQYIDGGFGHIPWWNYQSPGWYHIPSTECYESVAPHYIDLRRFAWPGFKVFETLGAEKTWANGNWFLLKYMFFAGNALYTDKGSAERSDEASRAYLRKVFDVQHRYEDAFTSDEGEPLVQTEQPNLYANLFVGKRQRVWTVLNGGYRTLRGDLMVVPHRDGAKYYDALNDKPVSFRMADGGKAVLNFELGPKSVGCIVQE